MATASPSDARLRDLVDRLYAATTQLAGDFDEPQIAGQALTFALMLTRSTEAVVGLGGTSNPCERIYSMSAATSSPLADDAITELLAAAAVVPVGARARGPVRGGRPLPAISAELRISGEAAGVLVVGRPTGYDETEKQLHAILAAHVARAFGVAEVRTRQHALEAALVELRAQVDQHAAHQIAAEEWIQAVDHTEREHELAAQVLIAVSSHATSGESLTDFYGRLARTVAELVGAEKVLFWGLKDDSLVPIPGSYGLSDSFVARLRPTHCEPTGNDLASRVVFKDLIFRANRADDPAEFEYVLERLGVLSAVSVPWRAGGERLGLLAAYDSTRPGGFSRDDTWVLQTAGLAAGLVTQLWHAQEDLRKSLERLTKVDAARQLLLKNMTTVVEKERRRFVSGLHDDALQKLTAAEMHAARLTANGAIDEASQQALVNLLHDTETALRKLVFEVHPPSLDAPDGLVTSINERVTMLTASGISSEVDLDIPEGLSHDTKALVFRQVSEALGNVERHSGATHVKLSIKLMDGGIAGVISDNGRGFTVAEKSNLPGHLGLQALKERALMAGGRYKIESEPGAGAKIEFWIPVDQ